MEFLSDLVFSTLSAPSQMTALSRLPLGQLRERSGAQSTTASGTSQLRQGHCGFFIAGDYAPLRHDADFRLGVSQRRRKDVEHRHRQGVRREHHARHIAGYAEHSYDLGGAGGQIDYWRPSYPGTEPCASAARISYDAFPYASLDFDVTRNVALGLFTATNTATTSGSQTGLKVGGGSP